MSVEKPEFPPPAGRHGNENGIQVLPQPEAINTCCYFLDATPCAFFAYNRTPGTRQVAAVAAMRYPRPPGHWPRPSTGCHAISGRQFSGYTIHAISGHPSGRPPCRMSADQGMRIEWPGGNLSPSRVAHRPGTANLKRPHSIERGPGSRGLCNNSIPIP